MKNKKLLRVLSIIALIAFLFVSIISSVPIMTAKAETAGTTPTLSETKVKISNDNDKMLLVLYEATLLLLA